MTKEIKFDIHNDRIVYEDKTKHEINKTMHQMTKEQSDIFISILRSFYCEVLEEAQPPV